MLMTYRVPSTRGRSLVAAGAFVGFILRHAGRLYRAIKHCRAIAVLADQDDHLLADIGLTRDDLRHAMRQPIWRDPTALLSRRAGATRPRRLGSVFTFGPSVRDLNRRALAELDDSQRGNLSDVGRQVRDDARQRMCA